MGENYQEMKLRKAREAEERRAAAAKAAPKRPVDVKEIRARHAKTGRKLSDAEAKAVTSSFKRLLNTTAQDLLRAEETARREQDVAEAPAQPAENLILQVGPEGSDLQQDFELLLQYTMSYEREKALAASRPGWGSVQIALINRWDLVRKPRPTPSFLGWNLTTNVMPTVPADEVVEA